MEAKIVSFEWKELFNTDIAVHYRVICKIVTTDGLEVTGSALSVINKAPQQTINAFLVDNTQAAESSAYGHANQILFRVTGENIPDRATLAGIGQLSR